MDSSIASESSRDGSHRHPVREENALYFAYGSNLHLAQMAHRCPESAFKGQATLHGYRWQINERGVANVIRSPEYVTKGFVYRITPEDEDALDRCEGVAKGHYEKQLLRVTLDPHEQYYNYKTTDLAQMIRDQTIWNDRIEGDPNPSGPIGHVPEQHFRHDVKALVYVSDTYITDGAIRDEYIFRIQQAAFDAVTFGISRLYVNTYLFPHVNRGDAISSALGQLLAEKRAPRQQPRVLVEVASSHSSHETRYGDR